MLPLIKNHIRILLAKKGKLLLLLILPVILFTLGMSANMSGSFKLNIGLVDQDQSALSAELAAYMTRDGNKVTPILETEAQNNLLDEKNDAVILLPQGFEKAFMAGEQPEISMRALKGQEITTALKVSLDIFLSSLDQLRGIRQFADAGEMISVMQAADQAGYQFSVRQATQGEVNRSLGFASGFLFYILSMGMMQVTSLILTEKQGNTLGRIRQAPVSRSTFLIGNFLTGVVFLLINLLALFAVSRFVFKIQTGVEMYLLWLYFGIIWIFFGIFLALVSKNQSIYGSVVSIATTIFAMLGGSFWPIWLMPEFMQKLAMITPHYWANDAMSLIQKQQSLFAQRTDLLALTGFLFLFFALGIFAQRRGSRQENYI